MSVKKVFKNDSNDRESVGPSMSDRKPGDKIVIRQSEILFSIYLITILPPGIRSFMDGPTDLRSLQSFLKTSFKTYFYAHYSHSSKLIFKLTQVHLSPRDLVSRSLQTFLIFFIKKLLLVSWHEKVIKNDCNEREIR